MNIVEKSLKRTKDWVEAIVKTNTPDKATDIELNEFFHLKEGTYSSKRSEIIRFFDQQKSWNKIIKQIHKENLSLPPKRFFLTRNNHKWVAAALIFIILTFGGIILYHSAIQKDVSFEQALPPGKSLAYLEINNSSRYDLGKIESTKLSNLTSAKLDSGKITYSDNPKKQEIEYHKIHVPKKGEFFIVLSDGSKVWLNSESSLGFPSQFTNKYRIVDLKGEAYFEIAKNKEQPFIVQTSDIKIDVVGTHFNVKAYPEEEFSYTTLLEGKIKISSDKFNEELDPNEQLKVDNTKKTYTKKNVNASIYTAWTKGKFVFKDVAFVEIMNTLSRWYDLKIIYENEKVKNEHFSISVDRYDDITPFLKHIEKISQIKFNLKNNYVIIK